MGIVLFGNTPWTNDEIGVRISMLEEALNRMSETDDMNVLQMQREIATWKELLRRRQ